MQKPPSHTDAPPAHPQTAISTEAWLLLAALALFWGGSFGATHVALAEVHVPTLVAFRVAGGALILWIAILVRGLPVKGGWRLVMICAVPSLLNNVLPWSLIAWGQQHVASGLAAILNSATAIFSVFVAALFFADERMTARKAAGVAFGLAGVVMVMGLSALSSLDLSSLAQLAILAASLSYAFSGAFARRFAKGIAPEVMAAGMLTLSSAVMVPWALVQDGMPAFGQLHAATLAALAYHALISSALAFLCYFRALRLAGAGNVGLVTLMIAPVSVLIGAVLFDESLSRADLGGFLLLALGLLIIDGRILARLSGRPAPEKSA